MHPNCGIVFQRWQGWMKMTSNVYRLHPAAILFTFLKGLREWLFLIIIGFITFRDEAVIYMILAIAIILVIGVAISVLSWYRFTYRIEEDELRIEYGLFIRKKRYISKNRIQSIDLTASIIHRLFKLVKVQVETAGSGTDAEAMLKAVKLSEGERLRQELKKGKTEAIDKEAEETGIRPFREISLKRLFIAGLTSGSAGIILAIAAVAFSEIQQFIPGDFYETTFEYLIGLGLIILIGIGLILLVIVWLLGVAGTMIKYGKFTITKKDNELFITRGLLETKQLTIPLKRIQAVGIQESIIRQPLGFVTVFAEVAGGSVDKGEDFSTVLFPIMRKEEATDFLNEFLPDYATQPAEWTLVPKRSLKFYLLRSCLPFIVGTVAVVYFFPSFSWIPMVLFIISCYLGYLRYKDAGYDIDGQLLRIRYRKLNKTSLIMYHKRIQAFEKKQHKLHQPGRLATMKLSIVGKQGAGKHYRIKDLEEDDVDRLSDWYSYRQ